MEIQDGVSKVIMLKKIKKYRSLSASSTLRELFKKGLIKRTVYCTLTRANVAAFFRRSWGACHTMSDEKFACLKTNSKS